MLDRAESSGRRALVPDGPVEFHDAVERLVQKIVRDFVLLDVELREDRLVDQAASWVVASPVELARLLEEVEDFVQDVCAGFESVVAVFEQCLEFFALGLDPPQPLLRPGGWDVSVGDEIEQVLLLDIEFGELGAEVLGADQECCLVVGGDLCDQVSDGGDQSWFEDQPLVVRLHGRLDEVDGDVGLIAEVLLLGSAEEVEVAAAAAVGTLDQQAGLTSSLVARTAPQAALEVVVVHTAAFAGGPSDVENLLDRIEQLSADERLVAPVVLLALVADDPDVIRLAEQLREFRVRDRPGGVATRSGL